MRRFVSFRFFVLILLSVGSCWAQPRADLWQEVDNAIDKGLPKTAISLLEQIIPAAIAEEAHAEAVKAIALKIVQEGQIQGNKAEEMILPLEAEIAEVSEAMRPVMEGILAHWYWIYFQQNRWRFLQRSQTAEAPGEDFTTWDLPRILAEIDTHFQRSLAAAEDLQAIAIAEYDDLLEKGTVPDTYRPTLYDFLVYEALSFYTAGEQGGSVPQDNFVIMADSPIFAPVDEFLQWEPQTTDQASAKLKAVELYQDLLIVHQDDRDPSARLDADLARLLFGKNMALGPEKVERFQSAVEVFVQANEGHSVAANARHAWAQSLYEQGDYVQAHAQAQETWELYPKTVGGQQCFNLVQVIEHPSATIKTERVWNAAQAQIQVQYRNVEHVYFRAYAVNFADIAKPSNDVYLSEKERVALLSQDPVYAWDAVLPKTEDYQTRRECLPAPLDLDRGLYYVVASYDPRFSPGHNGLSLALVWISDLALVVRDHDTHSVDGFVLGAINGTPQAGVQVIRWVSKEEDRLAYPFIPDDTVETDENGRFVFERDTKNSFLLVAETGDDQLATTRVHYFGYGSTTIETQERTIFFTDRAIYRPGQTIQYKGLCIRSEQAHNNYQTLANQLVTVVFSDTNGQEIIRHQHRSNDYGSFSGSFVAPRDRLLGQMTMRTEESPYGYRVVRIEEYKRPTFQVHLEVPTEAPRLDENVTVPGHALAYTGAAVGGAEVQWRVTRSVRLPRWCGRCWGRYSSALFQEQAIAYGSAVTLPDGRFAVSFTAKPDLAFAPVDEPVFSFQIHVDVTDPAGETRSADRSLRIGYSALQAQLAADTWQISTVPINLTITTESLDGVGEAAQGTVSIHRLQGPATVQRAPWLMTEGEVDLSNPENWSLGEVLCEYPIQTNALGYAELMLTLRVGLYRAVLYTQDRFGQFVRAEHTLHVLDPEHQRFVVRLPHHVTAPAWSVEPGNTFTALWGTGYTQGRAYIELEHRQTLLRAWWTDPSRSQELISQEVTEAMRGGFTLRITFVQENRAYVTERTVEVPWSNKELSLRWEHFRTLLEPGQPETWTAVVTGPDARQAVAEMVVALYDASLDQFIKHDWISGFHDFYQEGSRLTSHFENQVITYRSLTSFSPPAQMSTSQWYRHYPDFIRWVYFGNGYALGGDSRSPTPDSSADEKGTEPPAPETEPEGDLSDIVPRKNLDETAFFFPHLMSDRDGEVRIEFTTPEALTEWRFLGFAHDRELRSGFLAGTTVTAKDLMVQPNAPRFVREGDVIEFAVKVTNQSAARQTGQVSLQLADARTGEACDQAVGNLVPQQVFDVPSKESRTYSWRLTIPDGCSYLTYKAVGGTGRLSDGEEGFLPVLSRRILVNESLPLPIQGPQTKEFEFTKLLLSGESESLRHQSLTVQMVSQPAWYAVMALPYLMEQTRESSVATFTRLFANSLGAYIANSDPKIEQVFAQWWATPTLDSPLEKNEDLKAVMLEETPWLHQAIDESEARRNVGILFDNNRLNDEMGRAQFKLEQMQYSSGLWPWYPGLRGSEYLTLLIVTGYGRMSHLGLHDLDMSLALKALPALDSWMESCYRYILKHANPDHNHLSSLVAYYLYGRSFFLPDQAMVPEHQAALAFWLVQARSFWLSQPRQTQAHLALALKRFGDLETPREIMRSIKEFSVADEELGMFWRDTERSWWWYHAPIETQALMIEAFDEVMADANAVEDCRVWLLKQKQTQNWNTNRATADAIYSLLLRGSNLLTSDALVEVALGGEWIEPEEVEVGTGFYEQRYIRNEIHPTMGRITVKKVDEGVSWGSVHWQYLEDIGKVSAYEGTPLQLQKDLYVKRNTDAGPTLFPVVGALAVGDELVVRLKLRVDRDMEYVHLKDQRGSGTEPVNVLSGYRYQDGLGYYETTRATATHFYLDYLPKGVYVFEYSTHVQHAGAYQSGVASIQCLYAPEFNSHSQSFLLVVE